MKWRMLALVLAFCAFASIANAEFTLSSGIGLRLEYNDNIYLERDKEDDVIASATPNLSIGWEIPNLSISLNGALTMKKYLDHTEEDTIEPSLNQPTQLDLLYNLYRDLAFLRISDTFSQVVIDEGDRGGEGNTTVNLTSSNRFQLNPYLQLPMATGTQLKIGYTYENLWYNSNDATDSESHTYSATLTQELTPRITMSLNGSYSLYRPKNAEKEYIEGEGGNYDSDRKNASIGLTYQVTERLQVRGSYGHSWIEYDVRSNEDSDTWTANADYQITSSYSVGASHVKSFTDSVEDGASNSDVTTVYLSYSDRSTIKFSIFKRKSDYVEIDRDSDSYGGSLSGEHPFNDKFGVRGLLSYSNYDESGDDPSGYDRYSTLIALYYETRLGRISTGYTYTRNDADDNEDDYTNNIVFIETSIRFF